MLAFFLTALFSAQLLALSGAAFTQPTADETSVLISSEPRSGTRLLERIVVAAMEEYCKNRVSCSMGVKAKTAIDNSEYMVAVTAWPGARRMVSTARKHTIPNVGHADGVDVETPPKFEATEFAAKVEQTMREMPEGGKYIVLLRDPRDALMSTCHEEGDCRDSNHYALANFTAAAQWAGLRYEFFKAIQVKSPASVLFVFYEDLLVDTEEVTGEIAEFLGMPLPNWDKLRLAANSAQDMLVNITSRRKAPRTCGFVQELPPWTLKTMLGTMHRVLPAELTNKWSCGR